MDVSGEKLCKLADIAIKVCKSKQQDEIRNRIENSLRECNRVEARGRRKRSSELIIGANKIECELIRLESIYNRVKEKEGKIDSIEEYIKTCREYQKSLLKEKNHL